MTQIRWKDVWISILIIVITLILIICSSTCLSTYKWSKVIEKKILKYELNQPQFIGEEEGEGEKDGDGKQADRDVSGQCTRVMSLARTESRGLESQVREIFELYKYKLDLYSPACSLEAH